MRLIVFDLDGTLIDSHAFLMARIKQTFRLEGHPAPDDQKCRRFIGVDLHRMFAELGGVSGTALEAMVVRFHELYHTGIGDVSLEPLYPGVTEAILALHAQQETLLGIATNKGMRGVDRVLGLHQLTPYFVTTQTPDHHPVKPHPAMLQRAMVEAGVEPHETLMIGDTSYDMQMARSAGARALGVSWGSHPAVLLRDAGAHRIIDDFSKLTDTIDELFGTTDA